MLTNVTCRKLTSGGVLQGLGLRVAQAWRTDIADGILNLQAVLACRLDPVACSLRESRNRFWLPNLAPCQECVQMRS